MTLEEFILTRSYLPKNGTHTMEEHVMAMTMYVYGIETRLSLREHAEHIVVEDKVDSIVVSEETEYVESSNVTSGELIVTDIVK